MFKNNLQRPLTQNDSELLNLVIETEAVQERILLNTFLDEEIRAMHNTLERMEHQLHVLQDLNRPVATIELYMEKIEHIRYLLDDLVAQELELRANT